MAIMAETDAVFFKLYPARWAGLAMRESNDEKLGARMRKIIVALCEQSIGADAFADEVIQTTRDSMRQKSELGRRAAAARWKKDASALQGQCVRNADAMRMQCNETRRDKTRRDLGDKATAIDHEFDSFWVAYPKKISKGDAVKAWNQTSALRPATPAILTALEAQKNTSDWKKEGGKFIPYPATWLRASGWENDAGAMNAQQSKSAGRVGAVARVGAADYAREEDPLARFAINGGAAQVKGKEACHA